VCGGGWGRGGGCVAWCPVSGEGLYRRSDHELGGGGCPLTTAAAVGPYISGRGASTRRQASCHHGTPVQHRLHSVPAPTQTGYLDVCARVGGSADPTPSATLADLRGCSCSAGDLVRYPNTHSPGGQCSDRLTTIVLVATLLPACRLAGDVLQRCPRTTRLHWGAGCEPRRQLP